MKQSAVLVATPEVARYVKLHALVTDRSSLKVKIQRPWKVPRNGWGFRLTFFKSEPSEII